MEMNFKEFLFSNHHPVDDFNTTNLYMHNKGMSVRNIAKSTNKSIGEVYRSLKRNGMSPNRKHINHKSVLELNNNKLSYKHIGLITGYSPNHVHKILRNNKDGNSKN